MPGPACPRALSEPGLARPLPGTSLPLLSPQGSLCSWQVCPPCCPGSQESPVAGEATRWREGHCAQGHPPGGWPRTGFLRCGTSFHFLLVLRGDALGTGWPVLETKTHLPVSVPGGLSGPTYPAPSRTAWLGACAEVELRRGRGSDEWQHPTPWLPLGHPGGRDDGQTEVPLICALCGRRAGSGHVLVVCFLLGSGGGAVPLLACLRT